MDLIMMGNQNLKNPMYNAVDLTKHNRRFAENRYTATTVRLADDFTACYSDKKSSR
jgi:hypothetical protein